MNIGGSVAKVVNAFLEQRQRLREVDVLGVELGGNLLEAREALLEGQPAGSLRGHALAGTVPSRSTRSTGMSSVKCAGDVNALRSLPRGTEYPRAIVATGLRA